MTQTKAQIKKRRYNYMYWPNWYMKSRKNKAINAARKRARYWMEKKWKVRKFDWKEVDHINWNTSNNNMSNLRVLSKSKNRSLWAKKGARMRKKK